MFKQLRAGSDQRGFTLIEVLVAMAIMGITLGIVAGGSVSWTRAREQSGSAQQLVSFLRQAQQRALTEATPYCVTFDTATTYSMRKGTCTSTIVSGSGPDRLECSGHCRVVHADRRLRRHAHHLHPEGNRLAGNGDRLPPWPGRHRRTGGRTDRPCLNRLASCRGCGAATPPTRASPSRRSSPR